MRPRRGRAPPSARTARSVGYPTPVPVEPLTPKSERTRQRILTAALALFGEKGFAATTMRDIAARAEVSLGLTYRYFGRKEDLAAALYERMSDALHDTAAGLYGGTVASRFETLMSATIQHLDAHREAFCALAARAFDPTDDIGVLGEATEPIRARARATWEALLSGADDAPPSPEDRARLADVLYAVDLLVVLIWTQDRDPARTATKEAIAAVTQALAVGRPLLALPMGAAMLAQAASIAGKLGIGRLH